MKLNRLALFAAGAAIAVGGISNQAQAVEFDTGWVNLAGLNGAYTCSDANYGQGGTYMTSAIYGSRSSYTGACTSGHTSTSASSVVTSSDTLRAAATQTLKVIGARIAKVRTANLQERDNPVTMSLNDDKSGGTIGLSGGDARKGIGVWVQGAFTYLENDNTGTEYDGNVYSVMAGVDYEVNKRFLVGLSGGYENTDLDTDFNSGSIESDGFLVAPYASFRLNDMFSLDATAGYAWLDYDQSRKETATTGATFTGETDATRYFAALIANYDKLYRDKILVNAHVGVSYASEDKDAFTETSGSDSKSYASQEVSLGQATVGGRLGYQLKKVTPFVSAEGEFDFSKDDVAVASNQTKPEDDDFGLRLGAGMDFNLSPMVSGEVRGETVLLRDEYTEHKGVARVRVDF